jgi:hypothetical protein
MQAIQVTQVTQIGYHVPVMPTAESQAYKGIDHPIWFCWDCDTRWCSDELTRCPGCAREVGQRLTLDEKQTRDLKDTVTALDYTFPPWDEPPRDHAVWEEFRALLDEYAPWYDKTSRQTIQACYEALCARISCSKTDFAIAFFEAEYENAPEVEMMYDPNNDEVPAHVVAWGKYLDRQKQA